MTDLDDQLCPNCDHQVLDHDDLALFENCAVLVCTVCDCRIEH